MQERDMNKGDLIIAAFAALIGLFVGGAVYAFISFARDGSEVNAGLGIAFCTMAAGLLSLRAEAIKEADDEK